MSDEKPNSDHLLPDLTNRNLPSSQYHSLRNLSYHDLESPNYGGSEFLNPRTLWRIVRKRRWLILAIVAIVTTFVTIDAFRAKTLYQATGTVEVGPDMGTSVTSNEIFIRDNDDLFVTMNTNEIILRSTPLLEDVVVRLR